MTLPDGHVTRYGNDHGTVWLSAKELPAIPDLEENRLWRWHFRRLTQRRPVIWFVDDEAKKRAWFAEHHRRHFAVVTFSSRDRVIRALRVRLPCDAVVTDVFFPTEMVHDEAHASRLLASDERFGSCRLSGIQELWQVEQEMWVLAGFDIARDVAEAGAQQGQRIPVFLYSDKAQLVAGIDELGRLPSSAAVYWLPERVSLDANGEVAAKAVRIQRDRIIAALRDRQSAAPVWLRLLGLVGVKWGPLSFRLNVD